MAQARPLAAPVPGVSLSVPAEQMIGEALNFTVSFDNTSAAEVGYGPYIDLVFPVTGPDGAGAQVDDGIDFVSATYLGVPVTTLTYTFPGAPGCVSHPYAVTTTGAAVQVCGTPGDKLVVLLLPFGSFVPDQPAAVVNIQATMSNLADLNTPMNIQARGGYQFGSDALNNYSTDPSIVGSYTSSSVTPTLIRLKKTYNGPEDETATGPNYPRKYTVSVDIAAGQKVTNLDVTDYLANNLAFLGVDSSSPAATTTVQPPLNVPSNPTNNELTLRFASITGTTSTTDASYTFSYFVPLNDANGAPVINAASGDDVQSINQAKAIGDWTPIDVRDAGSTRNAVSDPAGPEHILTDKSIAIQKGVANLTDSVNTPGDVLEYTLTFQISDFFAFQDVVIKDRFSDGQKLSATYVPRLSVAGNGFSLPAAVMNAANYDQDFSDVGNDANPATKGTTLITFRISDELISRGRTDGKLVGGCIDPATGTGAALPDCTVYDNGATTATLTFRTEIQQKFTDTFLSSSPWVNQGDTLTNDVVIGGRLLQVSDLVAYPDPVANYEEDGSGASIVIAQGDLSKSIYAINGNTGFASPVKIGAGDTVTYRLKYTLPTSDFEKLELTDYLPLPIFRSAEITTFDPVVSAAAPVAGHAKFGPTDTFFAYSGKQPVLSTSTPENSVLFNYGDYASLTDADTVIDLLLTVTTRNDPFADKLFLTNQAHAVEGVVARAEKKTNAIVQIQLTEPVLKMTKGVVWTDKAGVIYNPANVGPAGITFNGNVGCASPRFSGTISSTGLAARPINSNITNGLDAGDRVTFAIVVENTGSGLSGAYDVKIKDTLPAGKTFVPGSLCITDGTGAAMTYTGAESDLFGAGITLNDPGPTATPAGAIDSYDPSNGRNIAVAIYDVTLAISVTPNQTLTNTATLFNYATTEGGPDFTTTDLTDTAAVTTLSHAFAKSFVSSEIVNAANTNAQVVIGELATYTATATIREGTTPNARVIDTLPVGLAYVDCQTVTVTGNITSSQTNGLSMAGVCGAATYNSGTRQITFPLGNLTNADSDADAETIAITYRVVVTDILANQQTNTRQNSARLYWASSNSTGASSAAAITILEPALSTTKASTINGGESGSAGQPVKFVIVLRHPTPAVPGDTDAFDVTFSDPLPKGSEFGDSLVLNPTFTVVDTAGTVTAAQFELVGNNSTGWTLQTRPGVSFDFPYSTTRTITLTVDGTLSTSAILNETVNNTAETRWTSMDGDPGQRSTYDTASVERTGADGLTGGGSLNDYRSQGKDGFNVFAPSVFKEIVTTNQAFTTNPNVAVGEQVQYHVQYKIPQGTAYKFRSEDTLPAGMAFVACDSVTGSAALTAESGFNCTNAVVSADGRTMTTNFGNVVNPDPDPLVDEVIDLTYTVVVVNDSNTNRGVTLTNTATASWGLTSTSRDYSSNGSAPAVTVVEPELRVDKTLAPTTGDAGDELTVTIQVTHSAASNADAFNATWTDDLVPAGMTYVAGTLQSTGGLAPTSTSEAATLLSAVWDSFPLGSTATLQFKVTVNDTVKPEEVLTNNGKVVYSSLPGSVSTPQSPYSAVSCERTGNVADCGTTNNDYTHTDPATFTAVKPQIAKALFATSAAHTAGSDVTIGETVTYDLTVTLPEGTSPTVTVTDKLPNGLKYVAGSAQLITTGFNGTFSDPTDPAVTGGAASGDDVVFTFDSITVPGDGIANNSFVIRLTALVTNEAGNVGLPPAQTTLTNSATVKVQGGTEMSSGTVDVQVVEPRFTLTKVFAPTTAGENDVVEVTLTMVNTGTSVAHDVILDDPLAKANFSAITPTSTPADFAYAAVDSGANTIVRYTGGPVEVGGTRVFKFTVKINNLAAGATLPNQATITQNTTLPGVSPDERDEPDVQANASLTGVAPDLTIVKDDSLTTVTPGQVVVYTLTVGNIGTRKTDKVTITETVPANTIFDLAGSTAGWSCANAAPAGTTCTFDIPGEVDISASIPVLFAVKLNTPLPAAVTQLINNTSVADKGDHGIDPPANNTSSDTDTITAQPDMTIVKTDGDVTGKVPGDVVVYSLTYQNVGDQDATGVVISETVPANALFNAAGSTPGWSCADGDPAGTACTFTVGNVAAGAAAASVNFAVQITPTIPAGVTEISNTASIADDGTNGADPTPPNNTSTDPTPVTAQPDLAILKDDGDATTTPGGTVTYTLDYQNKGNQDATGVVISETVPANSTFAGPAGWSCAVGDPAGTACTYSVGALAAGATGSVTFQVTVVNPLPAGVTQIDNTSSIADDGTNGADPTPLDNTDPDDTPVTAVPDMLITKDDGGVTTTPGGTVTYTLDYENQGDQGATGVVITETVPDYTTFAGPAGWSCAVGAVAGTTCTYPVGDVAAGATGSVTFQVTVVNPLPAGVTDLSNTATIADDGTNGADPTPGNNTSTDPTPTTARPDLTIVKDDGGVTDKEPGDTVTYTLDYANVGDQDATGVNITETVPDNTTFAGPAGWSCAVGDPAGTTCTYPVGDLASGANGSVNFSVKIDDTLPATVTQISNTASIADDGSNGADPSPLNNTSTDPTPVTAQPDLDILKDDGGTTISLNAPAPYTIVYQLDYQNKGNQDATGVTISETVPANTTFVAASSTATWSCADGAAAGTVCTYTVGDLAAGANGSVNFAVAVNATIPSGVTQIDNTASIADDGTNGADPTPLDNTDPDDTPVTAQPDLAILKDDGDATTTPGGTVTYTLDYQNNGNQGAENVVISETVPANSTFAGPAGWSCTAGDPAGTACTYSVGSLAAGATGSVTFQVTVVNPLPKGVTQIDNTASIADDGANGADPTPLDNTDPDDTPVDAAPDLTIDKDDGGATTTPDGTVTYTLNYANVGNQDATGVVLTETVPLYTTFVSPATWSCAAGSAAGTACTITLGDLAAGATGTVDFTVKVVKPLPAGVTQVDNTASIADDGTNGADPTPLNNTDPDDTPITAQPDMTIVKTDGDVTGKVPGDVVVYSLTYQNVGDQDATGVVISETVPANALFNAAGSTPGWSCADGDPAGTACTFTVGNVAAGAAAASVNFAVQITPTIPAGVTEISNTASIADDGTNGADPTPLNNTSTDPTPVTAQPDLAILKDDGDATTTPGGTVTYTLDYENKGNQDATGVVISETVPVNSTFAGPAGWSCTAGDPAGTACTYPVGALAAGATGSVTFQVTVVNPLPAGVTQIDNTASIADDGTNGADPTPLDNTDPDDTPVIAVPDLSIVKDNYVGGVSQGALLTYDLVITNKGNQDATGVVVTDTLPVVTPFYAFKDFAQVTAVSDGGAWSADKTKVVWPPFNLAAGASVTYTVTIQLNKPLPAEVTVIDNWSSVTDDNTNGIDPTPEDNEENDSDPVVDGSIGMTKTLVALDPEPSVDPSVPGDLTNRNAAIGQILEYAVTLTVPANATLDDLTMVDVLDAGLAFENCRSITVTGDLTIDGAPFTGGCLPSTKIAVEAVPAASTDPVMQGRKVTFDFDTLANPSTDTAATITIRYGAVVLDVIANQDQPSPSLNNQATWLWKAGELTRSADPVTLLEPDLGLRKSVRPTRTYPGRVVTFTLTVTHTKDSKTDAYDVLVRDPLPAGFEFVPGSIKYVKGIEPAAADMNYDVASRTVSVVWPVFPLKMLSSKGALVPGSSVIQFKAVYNPVEGENSATNIASVAWTSLPGNYSEPRSPWNETSHERGYDPASPVDVYGKSSPATVRSGKPGAVESGLEDEVDELPATGFAPGMVTMLGVQPEFKQYAPLDQVWLEVPALGVKLSVVGVPLTDDGWDLSWLGQQAGYLEGTAFPSWVGNSAVTAHVYNADGKPGPFVNLGNMVYGQQVILHAYGTRYTYEVREVLRVDPDDLSPLRHEERSWLTLLTCQGYDQVNNTYQKRVAVRTVLVKTEAEP